MHHHFRFVPLTVFLLSAVLFLSSCSAPRERLAVEGMSQSDLIATPVLALNDDKPGTPVNVTDYLVPGKYTIVHYYSPYAAQCAEIQPGLAGLPQVRSDLAVRTVNVNRPGVQDIDWQSPIMQQEQIGQLPFIRIYDPRGQLRAQGRPAYTQVVQWLK
jgi:hypothetical protein